MPWALLLPVAAAWTVEGWRWDGDSTRVGVQWWGDMPGWEEGEVEATLEASVHTWSEALPCEIQLHVDRNREPKITQIAPGMNVNFGDPLNNMEEGVLAEWMCRVDPAHFPDVPGPWSDPPACDVVFQDTPQWRPDWDVDDGACEDELSMQSQLTQYLGHLLGLGESCGNGRCDTEDEEQATMRTGLPLCDTTRSTLGEDDLDGLAAIYGAELRMDCERDTSDRMVVRCHAEVAERWQPEDVAWDFGDGLGATGLDVEHRYERGDVYTIAACVSDETCGDPRCDREVVTALDERPHDTAGPDDTASPSSEKTGCGCTTGGPATAWPALLLGLALVGRRRAR